MEVGSANDEGEPVDVASGRDPKQQDGDYGNGNEH